MPLAFTLLFWRGLQPLDNLVRGLATLAEQEGAPAEEAELVKRLQEIRATSTDDEIGEYVYGYARSDNYKRIETLVTLGKILFSKSVEAFKLYVKLGFTADKYEGMVNDKLSFVYELAIGIPEPVALHILIEFGSPLEYVLQAALMGGHSELARELAQRGAQINLEKLLTAMSSSKAATASDVEWILSLRQESDLNDVKIKSDFVKSASGCNAAVLETLLRQGFAGKDEGLVVALTRGPIESVRLLLNACASHGYEPKLVMVLATCNTATEEIVQKAEALLEFDPTVLDYRDINNRTVLHRAGYNRTALEALIKTKFVSLASVFDCDGNTAYDIANEEEEGQDLLDPVTPPQRAAYLKPLIKQAFDAAQNQNYEGLEAHLETYSLFVPFAFVPTNRPWLQPAEERLTLLDTLLQNDDVPIDIVCKVIKYGGKVRMDSIAIACENNRIDIVRALLDNGLVQVDKLGGPFTSITTLEFLQFFIETCGYQPDPESACTLLENASMTAEMATYLLSRSAGILSKDRPFPRGISNKDAKKVVFEYVFSHMGDVPLDEAFNAAIDSDPECTQLVEVFINAGCEITRDIVDRALLVRNDAVVVQLARHGAQITIKQAYAVAELAIAKDVDFVIKTCNVDVNEPFVDGDEDDPSFPSAYSKETTLLHGAVQSCDADTIEVVITNGADVNKIAYAAKLQYQNDGRERKYTPLATLLKSSEYSQVDILPLVRLLVKHGADPRIVCDGNQESVLFLAIAKGFEKVVRLLVEECKIDVNSVDSKVKPAFIAAIEANDKRVIDTFLSFPALDINKPDALGWSPAHHAVAKGNLDLLKKLVARGANIKATNSKGLTPLDIAKRRKERGCASELEKAGTLTPLTTAASSANAGAASEKATLTSCASCGDAVGDTVALLSCFHVMCVTCLAAEESDGKSEISCPFKVDSLLSCGTSVVLKDVRVILNTAKRIKVDVEEEVIKCKTCEQAFNPGHLEDLLGHTHAVEQDVDDGEDGGEDLDDGEDGMDDGDFDEGAEEEAGEDDMDVDGNDNRIGYKVNDIRFSVPGVDDDVDSYSFKSSSPFSMLLDESNKTPMEEHLRFAGNLRKIIGDAVAKLFSRRLQFLDKGDVTSAAQVEADIKAVEQHHDDVAVAQDRLRAAFNALQDKSLRLAIRGKAAESCETIVDELKEMELLNATPCLYGGSSPSTVHWPQFHWLFDREVNLASPSDAFQWSVKFVVNSAVARPPRAAVDLPPHVHLSSDEDVVVTSDGFIVVKRGHVLSKPTDGESSDKVSPFKDQHELFVYTLDGTFVRTIKYPNGLISMSTLGGKGLAVVKNESPTVLSLVDVGSSTGEEYDHVDLGDVPVLLDDGSHVKFTKLASSSSTADGSVILLCDVCRDEDDGQPAYSVCLVRWSPITREFEFAVEMAIQSDYEDSNRGTDSELFASGDLKILWFTDAYAYLKENTGRNELYYRLDLASGHAEYFGYRDDPEFVHFAKASAYDPFSHLTLHIVGNSIVSDIVVRQEAMPGQPEEILASFAGLNVDTVDVHKLNAHLEHVDTAALPAVFSGNGEPSIHAIGMGPQGEVVVINISKLYIF